MIFFNWVANWLIQRRFASFELESQKRNQYQVDPDDYWAWDKSLVDDSILHVADSVAARSFATNFDCMTAVEGENQE